MTTSVLTAFWIIACFLLWTELALSKSVGVPPQCSTAIERRIDCWPKEIGVTQEACTARGCCWQPTDDSRESGMNPPWCFFPSNYPNYVASNVTQTANGYSAMLTRNSKTFWPNDIMTLELSVVYYNENTVRFKIFDPKNARWEPPIPLAPPEKQTTSRSYEVSIRKSPFGITVKRKLDKRCLFDMPLDAPLVFADQFLQISSALNVSTIYGIGERRAPLAKILNQWSKIAIWNRDIPPTENTNLYGTHNFFIGMPDTGLSYGVFFLNSNAQEVVLQPSPLITYRTIGGVLDFFIFTGPSPAQVVSSYYALIGNPTLPPFWSMGFHLSRWGYGNLLKLIQIWKRTRNTGIPFDVQWNDIDYMSKYKDWTFDNVLYNGLPSYIQYLHSLKMRYVVIIDPAISNAYPGSYAPYDEGLKHGVFINNSDSPTPLVGKVWPGNTVYPDFTNNITQVWWSNCSKNFHKQVRR